VAQVIQLPDRGLDERKFAHNLAEQCREIYGLSRPETQAVSDLVLDILTQLPRPPMGDLSASLEAACGDTHAEVYATFRNIRQQWEQTYAALMLRVVAERIERLAETRGQGQPEL